MSDQDGNTNTERLSVPAILAKLIVLQQRNALPDPTKMDAGRSGSAQVDVDSRAALDMWTQAMGCVNLTVNETPYSTGDHGYWIYARDWAGTGWWVQVRAIVPDPKPLPPAAIDTETVAVLESVAGEKGADAMVVSAERLEEILDGLAVHARAVVGSDFNLDKAIDWALDQPDVSTTCGPEGGAATVELTDGTEIEWIPAETQWAVVPEGDDEEEAVSL